MSVYVPFLCTLFFLRLLLHFILTSSLYYFHFFEHRPFSSLALFSRSFPFRSSILFFLTSFLTISHFIHPLPFLAFSHLTQIVSSFLFVYLSV